MKNIILISLLLVLSCSQSKESKTAEDIYQSCLKVFERKGDGLGMAKPMCDSMRKACEKDINGKECKKAQRMINKA